VNGFNGIPRDHMLSLAEFTLQDIPRLIQWIPDARFLLQWSGPQYRFPLGAERIIETLEQTKPRPQTYFIFKALRTLDYEVVGHVELSRVDRLARTGHICRLLVGRPDWRGKGYGAEILRLLIEFGFETLTLDIMTLNVFTNNSPAIKCYRNLGFEPQELKTAAAAIGSESWDCLKMKLHRAQWRSREDARAHAS